MTGSIRTRAGGAKAAAQYRRSARGYPNADLMPPEHRVMAVAAHGRHGVRMNNAASSSRALAVPQGMFHMLGSCWLCRKT